MCHINTTNSLINEKVCKPYKGEALTKYLVQSTYKVSRRWNRSREVWRSLRFTDSDHQRCEISKQVNMGPMTPMSFICTHLVFIVVDPAELEAVRTRTSTKLRSDLLFHLFRVGDLMRGATTTMMCCTVLDQER